MKNQITMKPVLWIIAGVILLPNLLLSQVIADFEDPALGTMNWVDNAWGPSLTDVSRVADPSSASEGVLAVTYDGTLGRKGVIQYDGTIDPEGAQVFTYYVWLPADFPDSLNLELWVQDNASWAGVWGKYPIYNGYDIPKETWFPINMDMVALSRLDLADNLDLEANKIGKIGIQIQGWNEHDADTTWAGTIYFDNFSLVGANPSAVSDFEDPALGAMNWSDNGWGPSLTDVSRIEDPSTVSDGVLAVTYDGTLGRKGVIQHDGTLDPDGNQILTYYVWLPADTPDDLYFELWVQDNASWAGVWGQYPIHNVYDIPKETWYPINMDMVALSRLAPDDGLDLEANKLGKVGIQIQGWNILDEDSTWAGTIYFDNISFLGTQTGMDWLVADFENEAAGTNDFAKAWGDGLNGVIWSADPTARSAGVLNTSYDFANSTEQKGAFEKGNANIYSAELETYAHTISLDVYLPTDIPLGAQVSIFARDHVSWTWTEHAYFIDDSSLVRGEWNTLFYDVVSFVDAGEVDPTATLSVGGQISYQEAQTWVGNVYWDNLMYYGIPQPQGEVVSPAVIAEMDTIVGPGVVTPYFFTHLQWMDNAVGTETYNVYVSKSPINDVNAEGVMRIASKIPHGHQNWGHRPWTRDAGEAALYYAVTATSAQGVETELVPECKVGPITLPTSVTAKAQYVADFADAFVLDGLDTEFENYKTHMVKPQTASGDYGDTWTLESTDLNFNITFVIDDNYLYISGDVTDDDLRDPPGQAWEGDALEFYMGFYDAKALSAQHPKGSVSEEGTGDWRISFTAWGTTQINGMTETTIPGVETTVFQKFTGDGYIIEARMELDSLVEVGEDWTTKDGAMMPMTINGTDMDPSLGDESRTLLVAFGGSGDVIEEGWKRPSTWGFLEVFGGPTSVAENSGKAPLTYELFENYPNPFNPETTLKYQLAHSSDVKIDVYNILGKKVRTLVDGKKAAGSYSIQWDGTNDQGMKVSSGVYFCKMRTQTFNKTSKMLMMK